MIYLDHAATSPMPDQVIERFQSLAETAWGNAGGVYTAGREARRVLDDARESVAKALGASPDEIYFTAGGSESDNWAILGTCRALPDRRHIITTQIEHHAVLNPCRYLETQGYEVTYLPVDPYGRVNPETVEQAIRPDTALISIQMANNEIGTIEPVESIAEMAKAHAIRFHTDAVQAVGQTKIDLSQLSADLLSLSGHKFGAPKGIGVLFIRRGTRMKPFVYGGDQERGMRAGTENVIGACLMALALEIYRNGDFERMRSLRDTFIDRVISHCPDVVLNGSRTDRLPGNIHLSVPGMNRNALLMQLDMAGIAASAGSACTAGIQEPSHVISAIGGDTEAASLRLTLGHENTEAEMEKAASVLCRILDRRKG
ncbi:MAG: cysteine desulfurase [Clostridia bacterium]|nr:cysteine desulfurase [Clostridia bacterium]